MEGAEFDALVAAIERDGMPLRAVAVATSEVVFLKGVLEAYPGIAAVHARRGVKDGDTTRLLIATTKGFASEVDDVLRELAGEIPLTVVQK